MRKKVFGQKLSRGRGSRKALTRSLVRALAIHGSIETTKSKAKYVRRDIDRLMSLAKKGDVNSKRKVYALLGNDRKISDRLFALADKSFKDVKSGFTKTSFVKKRTGDNAEIVKLSWTKTIALDDSKDKKKKVKESKETEAKITTEVKEEKKTLKKKLSKTAQDLSPVEKSSKALGAIKKGFRKAPSK